MMFGLFLLFVTVSFVYPAEIFPELGPYRIPYWIGIAGLAVSAVHLLFKRAPLAIPQLWLLLAFVAMLGVSLAVAERWTGAPLFAFERFGPSLTMFVLAVTAVTSLAKLRIAAAYVVGLALVVLLQGVFAYHLGYRSDLFVLDPANPVESIGSQTRPFRIADASTEDAGEAKRESRGDSEEPPVRRIRGLGVFNDPNDLALVFIVACALLAGAWTRGATMRGLVLIGIPLAVLTYGVFLTHSRGGTLALLITLWLALGASLGRVTGRLLVGALAVIVLVADFAGGRPLVSTAEESAAGRIAAWTEGLEMLKSQPLTGVGYRQFLDHHDTTAHNSFVLCFAETGLVGYFFWLALLVTTFVQIGALRRPSVAQPRGAEMQGWASGLYLALVGFVSGAFFLSRTFVPLLYLLIGLSSALILVSRERGWPQAQLSPLRWGVLVIGCEAASILLIYLFVKLNAA